MAINEVKVTHRRQSFMIPKVHVGIVLQKFQDTLSLTGKTEELIKKSIQDQVFVILIN